MVGGVHFLGQLDQLLDDLLRGDGAVVVGVERLLEHLAEELRLCTRLRFERTLISSLSSFSSSSAATFLCLRPRTSARNWSERMLMSGLRQAGGGEDVDHLAFGGDGLGHELADGGVDLLGGLLLFAALFVQRGLHGLEEAHVVADLRSLRRCAAQRAKARESSRHDLHEALLAVLLLEDVLLRRRG